MAAVELGYCAMGFRRITTVHLENPPWGHIRDSVISYEFVLAARPHPRVKFTL